MTHRHLRWLPPARTPGAGVPRVAFGVITARVRDRRDSRIIASQLPELLEEVARALRSGASMRMSLANAAQASPDPAGRDARLVVQRLDHGLGLHDALQEWVARRPAVPVLRLVAVALVLAAEVGGSVARAVDSVADSIRAELSLDAEVRSLAAQARASAVLVAILPVLFGVVAGSLDRRAIAFYLQGGLGLGCLAGGLVLTAVGFGWMHRITSEIR